MSVSFNVELAGRVVGITAFHDSVYTLCRSYLTDSPYDFQVIVTEQDIQYERDKNAKDAQRRGAGESIYSDPYLETLAVYRKISTGMLDFDTLLVHGSAIAVDDEAYLFIAKSGTGKSTHTRLWREYFGSRAVMVNDDKPFLKMTDNGVFVCGTPWDGKHRLSRNISVPLKAIAILERSPVNHISAIDKRTALPILCQQSFRPTQRDKLVKAMALIDRLGNQTAFYRLGCNMCPDAVTVSYCGMNRRNTDL